MLALSYTVSIICMLLLPIILAVLFFGGIWGLWGVFFAIPLATLVQAVLKAWPNLESRPIDDTARPAP